MGECWKSHCCNADIKIIYGLMYCEKCEKLTGTTICREEIANDTRKI